MSGRAAIVAGASGLVGGHCLRRLLASGLHEQVIAFVRGPLNVTHKRLQQRTVDFERLSRMSAFPRAQDVFCCLGTTMKKAGSEEAFRKVDYEYVVRLAESSLRTGADRFFLVSAVGADPKSRVLYSRVKGEAEAEVARLGFAGLHIFRPSLLVGSRPEKRVAEELGIAAARLVSGFFFGPARKYRPIKADTVAGAMIVIAREGSPGAHIYYADEMEGLATLR
ncbi:MAG TPA: oxidoreductase [Thermoanaerobaculia bacterium]